MLSVLRIGREDVCFDCLRSVKIVTQGYIHVVIAEGLRS